MKKLLKYKVKKSVLIPVYTGIILTFTFNSLDAQLSFPFNFPNTSGDYLGWDSSVGDNLEITHNTSGKPIIFKTDNLEWMRILSSGRTRFGLQPAGVSSNYVSQWNIYVDNTWERGIYSERSNFFSTLPFSEGLSSQVDYSGNRAIAVYSKSDGNANTLENFKLFS